MNYRHGFHAGNFVDCAKHLLLVALLKALQRKDAGYVCIETHAGAGVYALDDAVARATGEADAGVQRAWRAAPPRPAAAQAWFDLIAAAGPAAPGAPLTRYPGSPALIAALARSQDRAVFCELVAVEAERLRAALAGRGRTRVEAGDGYALLKGLVPPPERRGLVFIDPPYEAPDESRAATDALADAIARWPSGVYALWHPLKDAAETAGLHRRVAAGGYRKVLRTEFRRVPEGRAPGLTGSGLVVVNPPYQFEAEAKALLTWLGAALEEPAAAVRVAWLVPE